MILLGTALLPGMASAQDDPLADGPEPWVEFMLGSRLPGGFFAIAGGVQFGRFAGPAVSLGLGGGPDGASVAIGNEVIVLRGERLGARGFAYWNYAFGRDESDEFSPGYRTITDASRSVKVGGTCMYRLGSDCSLAVRAGWSWALDVPTVTEQRPGSTSSHPSDDPYFSDALILGGGITIWVGRLAR